MPLNESKNEINELTLYLQFLLSFDYKQFTHKGDIWE